MILLARPSQIAYDLTKAGCRLGLLGTPRGLPRPDSLPAQWACDNDAFAGFHPERFRRMLGTVRHLRPAPLWVACPDVVADAGGTLRRFFEWEPEIRAAGLPVALVGQDGLTPADVPWCDLAAFFVGGSTAWKLGWEADRLCQEAKARGLWVHMGRCSTLKRIHRAVNMGCDSIDSACTAMKPSHWVPTILRWIRKVERDAARPSLFA